MLLGARIGERRVRPMRVRRRMRMALGHQWRRVIVGRGRRVLAGMALRGANQRDDAGDDRAKKRQGNDGFVHC